MFPVAQICLSRAPERALPQSSIGRRCSWRLSAALVIASRAPSSSSSTVLSSKGWRDWENINTLWWWWWTFLPLSLSGTITPVSDYSGSPEDPLRIPLVSALTLGESSGDPQGILRWSAIVWHRHKEGGRGTDWLIIYATLGPALVLVLQHILVSLLCT